MDGGPKDHLLRTCELLSVIVELLEHHNHRPMALQSTQLGGYDCWTMRSSCRREFTMRSKNDPPNVLLMDERMHLGHPAEPSHMVEEEGKKKNI